MSDNMHGFKAYEPGKNRRRVFSFLQSARMQRVRGQEGLRHDIL